MGDNELIGRALELARRHRPHPNPRVGAVVVSSDGEVIGEGSHAGPGHGHAEVLAIGQAGEAARGATLYVTLEPCNHHGRTPPCVDAILEAGLARVVVGIEDPDERVSGAGISRIRDEGIEVVVGVLEDEVTESDAGYFHHRRTGLPLVVLKYAMTLDGSVAAADGSSRWITSERAREDAHLLRAEADGVVVGAGTVRADDPGLDVRLEGFAGPQPRPVIVAGSAQLPDTARIWDRDPFVVSTSERKIPSGDLLVVDGSDGRPEPMASVKALADRGLLSLLLEGGPTLAGEWWRAGVISRGVVYVAGRIGGGSGRSPLGGLFATIEQAAVVSITGLRSLDGDTRVDFRRI